VARPAQSGGRDLALPGRAAPEMLNGRAPGLAVVRFIGKGRYAAAMTQVIVHFICRGNSFRSVIAEAYLNSLKFKNLRAVSSGTTAALDRAGNLVAYTETLRLLAENGIREFAKVGYGDQLTHARLEGADVVICMNQRVYDECQQLVTLPGGTRIWSVADIGEPGRIADTEPQRKLCREEAYQEIVEGTRQLVSEIL
jgi:protein-tyrosine-phosphatase